MRHCIFYTLREYKELLRVISDGLLEITISDKNEWSYQLCYNPTFEQQAEIDKFAGDYEDIALHLLGKRFNNDIYAVIVDTTNEDVAIVFKK